MTDQVTPPSTDAFHAGHYAVTATLNPEAADGGGDAIFPQPNAVDAIDVGHTAMSPRYHAAPDALAADAGHSRETPSAQCTGHHGFLK